MLDKRKMQEFIPKDTKTRIWDHKRGREGGVGGGGQQKAISQYWN